MLKHYTEKDVKQYSLHTMYRKQFTICYGNKNQNFGRSFAV